MAEQSPPEKQHGPLTSRMQALIKFLDGLTGQGKDAA